MFRKASLAFAIAAAFLVLLSSLSSYADSQTFSSQFFWPAIGRNPYLMLHSTETLHKFQFDAGLINSYAYKPLQIKETTGGTQAVTNQLVVSDVTAAFGIMEWLQFGFDMPIVLINQFRDPRVTPEPGLKSYFNMGDLRVEAKFRVLDPCKKYIGLAIVPFGTFGTGNDSHYVGDPGLTGGLKVAVDGRVAEKFNLTLNVGYQYGRKVHIRNIAFQHRLLLGAGLDAMLANGIDIFGEVNAIAAFNKLFKDRDMNPAEAMVGVRADIKDTGISISGGGGTCLVCGVKGAKMRGVIGVKYRFMNDEFKKLELEGKNMCQGRFEKALSVEELKALMASCPENPADYQPGVNDAACPKFYELRDMAKLVLRCPSNEADFNPKFHDAACPKVFDLADAYSKADVMNIYELAAAEMAMICPPDPADFNPSLHDVGCPKYYDLREVAGLQGRCPPSPEDYKAGVDDAACPKYYELREGYSDAELMAFADLAESRLSIFDGTGIIGGEIQTMRPIYFDFGSVKIRTDAIASIDQVIGVINKVKWIQRVRVGGNADAIGGPDANENLSLKRANAVIDYMRKQGVRPDVEFDPVAYGANRPAASNATAEGRALNRRVIFVVTGFKRPPPALPIKELKKKSRAKAAEETQVSESPEAQPAAGVSEEPAKQDHRPQKWQ